jgi:pyrroline-5-carboxylate reductase
MGEALAMGLLEAGWEHSDIDLAARRVERAKRVAADTSCRCVLDPAEILPGKQVVVVAVKPRDIHHLLEQIHSSVGDGQVFLSLAAGVPTTVFEKVLGEIPVVRAMPNTPAIVREGITGMAAGAHTTPDHLDLAERVLSAVGPVTRLEEHLLDAVTAVSGTGPAYAFLLAEALTEAAIREGLPRDVAEMLVHQTIKGAGHLLVETGRSPFELRSEVTSPGGTTAAAMHILEERGFRALVEDAVRAAAQRSRELGGFAVAAEEEL